MLIKFPTSKKNGFHKKEDANTWTKQGLRTCFYLWFTIFLRGICRSCSSNVKDFDTSPSHAKSHCEQNFLKRKCHFLHLLEMSVNGKLSVLHKVTCWYCQFVWCSEICSKAMFFFSFKKCQITKIIYFHLLPGPKPDNIGCLIPFNHIFPTAPREIDYLFGMPIPTLRAVVTHCSKTPNLVAMKLKRRVAPGHKARKGLERFRPAS